MLRQDALDALHRNPEVSVLIAGAGVNGAGVFRDLACQGVDALLVDQGDFGAGTSAASSHLIHGGLRYLEYGDFRLVREAVQERNRLLVNASHYIQPLPTCIPLFSHVSGLLNAPLRFLGLRDATAARGTWIVRLGLALYDRFSRSIHDNLPASRLVNRQASRELFPALHPRIKATAHYHDAWVRHPERLILELIQDGLREPAVGMALNYMSVVARDQQDVLLRDHTNGTDIRVRPRVIVNAAGPWIDQVNQRLDRPSAFIGGTKGSHLVVAHDALYEALQGHMMFFEHTDGRVVLICPFHDRVLLGTTDIRVDDPDDTCCTPEEEAYLLTMVSQVFPRIALSPADIVFRFCGVRPLGASDKAAAAISRDHQLRLLPGTATQAPVYSLIGGKWTTFRAFAEQTVDAVLTELELPRRRATQDLAIGGGRAYPDTPAAAEDYVRDLAAQYHLRPGTCRELFARYGTGAEDVASFCAGHAQGEERMPLSCLLKAELVYLCRHEMVVHLEDLLLRRTLLAMLGQLSSAVLEEVVTVMASELEWTATHKEAELRQARDKLQTRHGVVC